MKRKIDHHGYVRIRGHLPLGMWEYEHRMLIEQKIGRRLTRNEAVHHLNGVKSDNRLENLKLMGRGEHIALHNSVDPKRKSGTLPAKRPAKHSVTLSGRVQ